MQTIDWSFGLGRGLNPEYLRRNVAEYVNQGAKSIRIEIILTTYEELMEAEFGRSIHELRVLRLRHRLTYAGPLGQNAGYLIEYLLALASSPTVSIPEIPIKMYGRYSPRGHRHPEMRTVWHRYRWRPAQHLLSRTRLPETFPYHVSGE
jgi:hypothetical protein